MNGSFDVSTIVFAILAVFVVWKLRSVLGTRTGNERPPFDPFAGRKAADPKAAATNGERDNVIALPGAPDRTAGRSAWSAADPDRWKGFAAPNSAVATGLDQIHAASPDFAPKPFLEGARVAYETIIQAFARGDRATLKPLLAKDVFDGFDKVIAERETRGETVETTFVSVSDGLIEDAQLRDKVAQIAVRFDTKLITLTRAKDGSVIDGSPDAVSDMLDLWTFARDVTARDPNWKLVATETGQ